MEFTDYWRVLRAHWGLVLCVSLLGVVTALGWAFLQPKVYEADARGIVSVGVSKDLNTAVAGETYSKSRAKAYLDVARSRAVAETVIQNLNLEDKTPEDLISNIAVQNPIDTANLKFTARAETPESARELAEAWVKAVGQQVEKLERGSVSSTEESLVTFRSLESAQLPTSPSSPNTKLALILGLLAGLVLAVFYVLLRNTFDRKIRSVSQVEAETAHSVIGTIPFNKDFSDSHRLVPSSGGNDLDHTNKQDFAVAEAARKLRTNLQFMNVDKPPRIIVVSSALPQEGKTTVLANLSQAVAATGQRVVVVDADLRRPMLAETFGAPNIVGLTDVLVGRATLQDVLQPWGSTGNLFLLASGTIPPNPSELLNSKTMQNLLNELAEHAIVFIDTPPLLPVTDAAILTARTDGALVVTRYGESTYEELKRALHNLDKVNGRPLGIILNGTPRSGDGYSAGYYTYYTRQGRDRAPAESFDAIVKSEAPELSGRIRRRARGRV